MPRYEGPPPRPANDNWKQPPFNEVTQEIIDKSEANNNGFFDKEMLMAFQKGEVPDYDRNTEEGLRKSRAYALLKHFKEVADDPDVTEQEYSDAFGMLMSFARLGSGEEGY